MYNLAMNLSVGSFLIALLPIVILLPWGHTALAEYTLVLKNGRRITVEAYREEGGMIKFHGLGGEIGIGKDQVQTILKGGESEGRAFGVSRAQSVEAEPTERAPEQIQPTPATTGREPTVAEKAGAPPTAEPRTEADLLAEERAKEEKEYQQKVKEMTEKLKASRARYAIATRGSSGPEPSVVFTDEQIKARTDELTSRVRDLEQSQAGTRYETGIEMPTPVPFAGDAPPLLRPGPVVTRPGADPIPTAYTGKQKELSGLRSDILNLETERQKLIEEMRQKNFDTGSLFLE